jgi:hypothetical protein
MQLHNTLDPYGRTWLYARVVMKGQAMKDPTGKHIPHSIRAILSPSMLQQIRDAAIGVGHDLAAESPETTAEMLEIATECEEVAKWYGHAMSARPAQPTIGRTSDE